MDRLRQLIGIEHPLTSTSQAMHFLGRELHAPVVGAMHVTCADESEDECAGAFQRGFVRYFLPPLKPAQQSAFRIANLGGRYEWGAVRVVEEHFATAASHEAFKLLLVKVNSHAAIREDSEEYYFGILKRYDRESTCCGALGALLAGDRRPFADQLREMFLSEGKDRIATLLDEEQVDPACRALYAAIVSARLQARKVILDVQDYKSTSPTLYLVIPCVTINRPQPDTEIVCGVYTADDRRQPRRVDYSGLGDDPAGYRLRREHRRFIISDDHIDHTRAARDHRELAMSEWRRRTRDSDAKIQDDRLDNVWCQVAENKHRHDHHCKILLRGLLPILAELDPISAAVLLFANGVVDVHHVYRVHRLARQLGGSQEARRILGEIHQKVDHIEPARAQAMIELLMREYRV